MNYPTLDLQATGRRIKELRTERGISVNVLCRYMGFENPQAIYKWQRGESLPTVDNLYALCKILEVPMERILCETGEACASPVCVLRIAKNVEFENFYGNREILPKQYDTIFLKGNCRREEDYAGRKEDSA